MTRPPSHLPLTETRLDATHVPAAFALSTEAHWNQTRADWQWMLGQGEGFGLVEPDGTLVASALALPFGGTLAWISMVLVTARRQRQGLATRLMERAMAACAALRRTPLLDATPAGREVYRTLGFCDGPGFARWARVAAADVARPHVPAAPTATVRALQEGDWAAIAALDGATFGANRLPLLRALAERAPALARVACADAELTGFLLARNGRSATQLGPVVARDEATACVLLGDALRALSGAVYVDAFDAHRGVQDLLMREAFTPQRPFTRMALVPGGGAFAFPPVTNYFAAAGPELG